MDPDTIGKSADAAKAIAEALSVPNEVKTEVLKPGATSLGQAFQSIIVLTLGGFISRGIIKQAKITSLSQQAVEFFNQNPDASYDDAKTMLLVKEVEDSKFSIDEDDMRTRFAKLIATTADAKRNTNVSPNYSTVLASLDSQTASLLETLSTVVYSAVGFLEEVDPETGGSYKPINYYVQLNDTLIDFPRGALDELKSLGLIELKNDISLSKELYSLIDIIVNQTNERIDNDNVKYEVKYGVAYLTEFGKSFIDIVK